MLLQNYKEKREEQLMDNFSNSQERIQKKKGKHSFPYINSVESEFGTSMNCCVKLIYLMLNILE